MMRGTNAMRVLLVEDDPDMAESLRASLSADSHEVDHANDGGIGEQMATEGGYDVIVLDCAPTAESLRFVSMPTTLDWYMKHVFPMERRMLNAVRPLVNRMSPVELPTDSYFANIKELFTRLDGIDTVLQDPQITSVRLVTNAERMVLRETQRAFVYFLLHGMSVDGLIVNRVLPEEARDSFLGALRVSQQQVIEEMVAYFEPVPVRRVPMFAEEVVGLDRLDRLADLLQELDPAPAAVTRTERPYSFERRNGVHQVRVAMPFAGKGEVGLFKKGDELVVEVGVFRRHIGLPTTLAALVPVRATFEDRTLVVELGEPR